MNDDLKKQQQFNWKIRRGVPYSNDTDTNTNTNTNNNNNNGFYLKAPFKALDAGFDREP